MAESTPSRVRISYVLRDAVERQHRFGINALKVDVRDGTVFTAGRDAVVRSWNTSLVSDQLSSSLSISSPSVNVDNGVCTVAEAVDTSSCTEPTFMHSYDQHTHWVNDVVVFEGSSAGSMVSCSSDHTIKVWNTSLGLCKGTLHKHKDYVKALAYAPDAGFIASAGLDHMVNVWDVEAMCSIAEQPAGNAYSSVVSGSLRDSIYSLAMNRAGTVIVSGSTDKCIHVWDPRTCKPAFQLKGHADNVKTLALSRDGTLCLSGSSDGTIKLWDLGQQMCRATFAPQSGPVWTLIADDSFSRCVSGGREGRIVATDLRHGVSALLLTEEAPVLCVEPCNYGRQRYVQKEYCGLINGDDQKFRDRSNAENCSSGSGNAEIEFTALSLWVSTTNSDLRCWYVGNVPLALDYIAGDISESNDNIGQCLKPRSQNGLGLNGDSKRREHPILPVTVPTCTIRGAAGIIKYHVLNSRLQVVSVDSGGQVAIWDVLRAVKVKDYGCSRTFESVIESHCEVVSVPNWFSIDNQIGYLTIHLDHSQYLNAEVYSIDARLHELDNEDETRVNIGALVLQTLFAPWQRSIEAVKRRRHCLRNNRDGDIVDDTVTKSSMKRYFSIASHTPIVLSDVSKSSPSVLFRITSEETGDERVHADLLEVVPQWVQDCVLKETPTVKDVKASFIVKPLEPPMNDDESLTMKALPASSNRFNAIRILRLHKIMRHIISKLFLHLPVDESDNIEDYIELYCNGELMNPRHSLATVRQFYWKSSSDLVINYRRKPGSKALVEIKQIP